MNSYVYWNNKDNDCKKMFSFMRCEEIISLLSESNVCVKRINTAEDANQALCTEFQSATTVFFLTHGLDDTILKYKSRNPQCANDYPLINVTSSDCLSKKIIIAICCDSAEILGPACVNRADGYACISYLGFRSPIYYNNSNGRHYSADIVGIIYKTYSQIFKQMMLFSLDSKPSIKVLMLYLNKEMGSALVTMTHFLSITPQTKTLPVDLLAEVYNNTIEPSLSGLVLLGDETARVFL